VEGCMDEDACNYNGEAIIDDNSCEFAVGNYDCDGNCITGTECLECELEYKNVEGDCYYVPDMEVVATLFENSGLPNSYADVIQMGTWVGGRMEVLRCINCYIYHGPIPEDIGNMTALKKIQLYGNYLTGDIPASLWTLENLTVLSLSYNDLTGEIPSDIGNLTNLTELSLSGNTFSGSMPSEIGHLSNLTNLALANNEFSDVVPESICNLVENESYINFYGNDLCPPYPACLEEWHIGYQSTEEC
ncbi:uncharacterized protein METZ01_LOCUS473174, partial [marine metagenome]